MRIRADIENVLTRHTGQSVQTLRADTDHDRVFTATAAREYGLLDTRDRTALTDERIGPQDPSAREVRL